MMFVTHPNAIIGHINIERYVKNAVNVPIEIFPAMTCKPPKYTVMTKEKPTSIYIIGHMIDCAFARTRFFFRYTQLNFSKSPISTLPARML